MSLSDLEGENLDPNAALIVMLFNGRPEELAFTETGLVDLPLELHPVLANSADPVVQTAPVRPGQRHVHGARLHDGRLCAARAMRSRSCPRLSKPQPKRASRLAQRTRARWMKRPSPLLPLLPPRRI